MALIYIRLNPLTAYGWPQKVSDSLRPFLKTKIDQEGSLNQIFSSTNIQ